MCVAISARLNFLNRKCCCDWFQNVWFLLDIVQICRIKCTKKCVRRSDLESQCDLCSHELNHHKDVDWILNSDKLSLPKQSEANNYLKNLSIVEWLEGLDSGANLSNFEGSVSASLTISASPAEYSLMFLMHLGCSRSSLESRWDRSHIDGLLISSLTTKMISAFNGFRGGEAL